MQVWDESLFEEYLDEEEDDWVYEILKLKTVKYKYADHRTGKTQTEEIGVLEFIGKMMQQLLPKGFHRVKYYGLHHTKTFKKARKLIIEAMSMINIEICIESTIQ